MQVVTLNYLDFKMNVMKRISLSQSPTASCLLAHISCSVKKKKWKAIWSNSMLILFALFRHLFPNQTTLNAPLCLLITFCSLFPILFELQYYYKYFTPKNINSITINITLEGTEKIKTEKKKWQQNTLNNIFFTSAVRKHQETLKWLLDFDWLLRSNDYLILIFYWFISVG